MLELVGGVLWFVIGLCCDVMAVCLVVLSGGSQCLWWFRCGCMLALSVVVGGVRSCPVVFDWFMWLVHGFVWWYFRAVRSDVSVWLSAGTFGGWFVMCFCCYFVVVCLAVLPGSSLCVWWFRRGCLRVISVFVGCFRWCSVVVCGWCLF